MPSDCKDVGVKFVYIGNVFGAEEENSLCPNCNKILIKRVGYQILEYNIKGSKCIYCQESIAGKWKD